MLKKILLGIVVAVVLVVAIGVWRIGPSNLIGMALYDQRREGDLAVGDLAPDVELLAIENEGRVSLASRLGDRMTVIVFGSFT